jgi:photosystem II stability/assembly factor-like uncharacterized protein
VTTEWLQAVAFAPNGGAVAVGAKGTVLAWDGDAWRAAAVPTEAVDALLRDVAIGPDGRGWAVGNAGLILRRDAAGGWSSALSPTSANLAAVEILDGIDAWTVGADGAILYFRSEDAPAETLAVHRVWLPLATR